MKNKWIAEFVSPRRGGASMFIVYFKFHNILTGYLAMANLLI